MKRAKRNKVERAFTQGYKAGIRGHSEENCPYMGIDIRASWFSGWRDGRTHYIAGYIAES